MSTWFQRKCASSNLSGDGSDGKCLRGKGRSARFGEAEDAGGRKMCREAEAEEEEEEGYEGEGGKVRGTREVVRGVW